MANTRPIAGPGIFLRTRIETDRLRWTSRERERQINTHRERRINAVAFEYRGASAVTSPPPQNRAADQRRCKGSDGPLISGIQRCKCHKSTTPDQRCKCCRKSTTPDQRDDWYWYSFVSHVNGPLASYCLSIVDIQGIADCHLARGRPAKTSNHTSLVERPETVCFPCSFERCRRIHASLRTRTFSRKLYLSGGFMARV